MACPDCEIGIDLHINGLIYTCDKCGQKWYCCNKNYGLWSEINDSTPLNNTLKDYPMMIVIDDTVIIFFYS
jgi:hypothetical protein